MNKKLILILFNYILNYKLKILYLISNLLYNNI